MFCKIILNSKIQSVALGIIYDIIKEKIKGADNND